MLKDITIGQYYPTGSFVHKLDPRTKLMMLILFIVFIFVSSNIISLALSAVVILLLIAITKVPFTVYLKNIKTILPIIILTAVLNAFYGIGENVIFKWWILTVTSDGLVRAGQMALRIFLLIIVSAMLTYTTTPTALTGAIERLLSPLKYIGLKNAVHAMAMMMTIALRFIPTLIDETERLMNAQKARGADMESGGLIKKIKSVIPILIPLLISSIKRAYDLAEAMECRCYDGGENRTVMKKLSFSKRDYVAFLMCGLYFVSVILANIYFK